MTQTAPRKLPEIHNLGLEAMHAHHTALEEADRAKRSSDYDRLRANYRETCRKMEEALAVFGLSALDCDLVKRYVVSADYARPIITCAGLVWTWDLAGDIWSTKTYGVVVGYPERSRRVRLREVSLIGLGEALVWLNEEEAPAETDEDTELAIASAGMGGDSDAF